jgi:hypothetical protein
MAIIRSYFTVLSIPLRTHGSELSEKQNVNYLQKKQREIYRQKVRLLLLVFFV